MRCRYKILVIAEAANPEWTSVPLIGWSLSHALAKITNAHILTHVRNRGAFERAGLVEGHDFTAIDNEIFASPLFKLSERFSGGAGTGWTAITAFSSVAYYSFEQEIWRRLGERLCAHEFDLVHRITPLSPTSQSLIAKRLAKHKVPFVIGPLNGGVPWPKAFVDRQHAEREWLSHVRWLYKLMPYYRSTRQHSAALIAGSRHTYGELPEWAKEKCVYIPENGVDLERFKNPRTHSACLPLSGAFVGRLVPYKGADMLLEAAAKFLKEGRLELHIVGDGPQRALLETMVEQLEVRSRVHFHGWVPHLEVQETLRTCDFLALPSIREFGGGVVIESMALGVAPIVADYAGPSELVDDKTGIRIRFHDKQSLIKGMKAALNLVTGSPQILDTLGAAGRKKVVEKLTWEAKARQILSVYDAVLSGIKNLNSLDYDRQRMI
jgi:glycosyltransferase involved in cell wall biosynthesis